MTVCFTHTGRISFGGCWGGVVKESGRNCPSISFRRPWETAPQSHLHISSVLAAFQGVRPEQMTKLFPVHKDFGHSHGLIIIRLFG